MFDHSQVLVTVQLNVDRDNEPTLNRWFESRIVALLDASQVSWARRYSTIHGDLKYLAAFGITDKSLLSALLATDGGGLLAGFEQVEGTKDLEVNAWEQATGTPFSLILMQRDYIVAVVPSNPKPGKEAEFLSWYSTSHMPNVAAVPGYMSGGFYSSVKAPAVQAFGSKWRYLTLYEIHSEGAVPIITNPNAGGPEAKAEYQNYNITGTQLVADIEANIYRPLSKHWPR